MIEAKYIWNNHQSNFAGAASEVNRQIIEFREPAPSHRVAN